MVNQHEEGLIYCLLRRADENADETLARFYESMVDSGQLSTHILKSMYLFIQDNALDDIAVTPRMLAQEFDIDESRILDNIQKYPVDSLSFYVKEINKDYIRRVATDTAQKLMVVAKTGNAQLMLETVGALSELDTQAEKRVYTLAEQAAVFLTALENDQQRIKSKAPKPTFPLAGLNTLVPRLMDDDIILVTAKSKMGKSAFSTQFAYANARNGLNIAYFHFEDPPARVGYRRAAQVQAFLSQEKRAEMGFPYGITYRKMMSEELSGKEKDYINSLTMHAMTEAGTNLTYIYASAWTCEKMVAVWRQLHRQRPFDLIIVDYLNKMALSSTKLRHYGQWGSRGQDVELIKQEAGRPNARVPVVLIQQENEDGTARDSKDSYIKSQVWISLQREESPTDPDRFEDFGEIVVKRANDGSTGAIKAHFYPPFMVWAEV